MLYIDFDRLDTFLLASDGHIEEKTLLDFDTTSKKSWDVDINGNYIDTDIINANGCKLDMKWTFLQRKKIRLIQTQVIDNDTIYVYELNNYRGELEGICRIYYSKAKKKFVELGIYTHFGGIVKCVLQKTP